MGVTAGIIAAVSTIASIDAQKKQQKAAKEERAANRAKASVAASRERRKALRAARIQRGAAVNRGFVSGGEGSTVSGATSSATVQAAGEIGFVNSSLQSSLQISNLRQDQADAAGKSQMFGQIAGLSSSFATFPSVPKKRPAPISTSIPI